jgi:hypothetical protein
MRTGRRSWSGQRSSSCATDRTGPTSGGCPRLHIVLFTGGLEQGPKPSTTGRTPADLQSVIPITPSTTPSLQRVQSELDALVAIRTSHAGFLPADERRYGLLAVIEAMLLDIGASASLR